MLYNEFICKRSHWPEFIPKTWCSVLFGGGGYGSRTSVEYLSIQLETGVFRACVFAGFFGPINSRSLYEKFADGWYKLDELIDKPEELIDKLGVVTDKLEELIDKFVCLRTNFRRPNVLFNEKKMDVQDDLREKFIGTGTKSMKHGSIDTGIEHPPPHAATGHTT